MEKNRDFILSFEGFAKKVHPKVNRLLLSIVFCSSFFSEDKSQNLIDPIFFGVCKNGRITSKSQASQLHAALMRFNAVILHYGLVFGFIHKLKPTVKVTVLQANANKQRGTSE